MMFRVDPRLLSHCKVVAALPPGNVRTLAFGLWLQAGMWSALQGTEGFVPAGFLREVRLPKRVAASLVEAGLWSLVDGGFAFHDWEDWQSYFETSAETSEADAELARAERRRQQEAERSRQYRKRVRDARHAAVTPDRHAEERDASRPSEGGEDVGSPSPSAEKPREIATETTRVTERDAERDVHRDGPPKPAAIASSTLLLDDDSHGVHRRRPRPQGKVAPEADPLPPEAPEAERLLAELHRVPVLRGSPAAEELAKQWMKTALHQTFGQNSPLPHFRRAVDGLRLKEEDEPEVVREVSRAIPYLKRAIDGLWKKDRTGKFEPTARTYRGPAFAEPKSVPLIASEDDGGLMLFRGGA